LLRLKNIAPREASSSFSVRSLLRVDVEEAAAALLARAAGAIYPYSILPRLHPGSLLLISAFGLLRLVFRRRTTVQAAAKRTTT